MIAIIPAIIPLITGNPNASIGLPPCNGYYAEDYKVNTEEQVEG
jgi:hypothetical protein